MSGMKKEENRQMTYVMYDGSKDEYEDFLEAIKKNFAKQIEDNVPLFKVNTGVDLFNVFLDNLPKEARQHYTCNACRHFVNRFGNIVTIDEEGNTKSAVWGKVPSFFRESVSEMENYIKKGNVVSTFVSSNSVLGNPVTGEWEHMSVTLPSSRVYRSITKTAGQRVAEYRENNKMLTSSLLEYDLNVAEKAMTLLRTDALYRSDKVLGVAEWFFNLHMQLKGMVNQTKRKNLIWLAVAKAPDGFCHIKSSMIGTLLDDIASGYSMSDIERRFTQKMNPSNYMRSTSVPTVNHIEQAEKFVEKLGIANSLVRRYARIDEIPEFIWKFNHKNKKTQEKKSGIFSNIVPSNASPSVDNFVLPTTTMTWSKFEKTVLHTAEKLEVRVNDSNKFVALVTASDETAPNIFQWDNPFSWYYHGGIDAEMKRRVESAGGQFENTKVRCTLMWNTFSDLDIHCDMSENGHIYYGNKRANNGWLDVDANAGGSHTLTPVENIRWSDYIPNGNYKFYVHNYSDRNYRKNPYVAELNIDGKIYRFSGNMAETGDQTYLFSFNVCNGVITMKNTGSSETNVANPWNTRLNDFKDVTGIVNSPNMWGERPVTHTGQHVFFLLDDCKDESEGKGRGFFNEMLKPELREIRKTLEAYTANSPIHDMETASACGVGYSKDSDWDLVVKVTANNSTRMILIDRFD